MSWPFDKKVLSLSYYINSWGKIKEIRSFCGYFTSVYGFRIQDEFKSGEGYWALERKLCYALINKTEVWLSSWVVTFQI